MKHSYRVLFFIFSFFIFYLSSLLSQNVFNGEYIMVQYFAESGMERFTSIMLLTADSDSSGSYTEMYSNSETPESGTFTYHMQEDRTYTIIDEDVHFNGIIDENGEVFSMVEADTSGGEISVGIRKSSGRQVSDLMGDYMVAEYNADLSRQSAAYDIVRFDGEGGARLYRLLTSVGEPDSTDIVYTVAENGEITLDSLLHGIMSADGQVFTAANVDEEWHTLVIGIKTSDGQSEEILTGNYIYNQFRGEYRGDDDQSDFYSELVFDGVGDAEIIMFQGIPSEGHISYDVFNEGGMYFGNYPSGVSHDGRYFSTVDLSDSTSVAIGFGILTYIKKNKRRK